MKMREMKSKPESERNEIKTSNCYNGVIFKHGRFVSKAKDDNCFSWEYSDVNNITLSNLEDIVAPELNFEDVEID